MNHSGQKPADLAFPFQNLLLSALAQGWPIIYIKIKEWKDSWNLVNLTIFFHKQLIKELRLDIYIIHYTVKWQPLDIYGALGFLGSKGLGAWLLTTILQQGLASEINCCFYFWGRREAPQREYWALCEFCKATQYLNLVACTQGGSIDIQQRKLVAMKEERENRPREYNS